MLDRSKLEQEAFRLGFSTVRIAKFCSPTPEFGRYKTWLESGFHGDMDYLARGQEPRAYPELRLPDAQSVVVLSWDYPHRRPPDPGGPTGHVARYAWNRDYHNLVGKRLKKLKAWLRQNNVRNWGGIDTAPVLERAWARLAGLGYLGKNTMSIIPSKGSWYFLAVLFVSEELEPDPPISRDHCGSCARCITGCPTSAFPKPGVLDATRCIAYWTIESRELAPPDLRPKFGRWFFGCDDCQEVCPHNRDLERATHADLQPRNAWVNMVEVLRTPDSVLLNRFVGTPLRRPGAAGLKRNALYVLANLGDESVVPDVSSTLDHPSPVVRGAAIWALHRLGASARTPENDPDPLVQQEIDWARS